MRLSGHHALVTGGGTGIGAAIAKALAADGAKVTLVGRREDKLRETAARIEGAAIAVADVTSRPQVDASFVAARAAHGPVTILVNNAGAASSAPFAEVREQDWRSIMAVNLDALLHCCQAALPDLLAAPSARIVTIASVAGLKGYAYVAPYVAAKHGAVGLTRALATEFVKTALTVNAVCPGFTETDMVGAAVQNIQAKTGRGADEARAELARFNPQGRLITPEEVASAVLWLCLAENGSVTGQAIPIAGGEIM
ncbi:MAG: SDR family oxidoreductase [Sphingosinicella sp.]|nr:SDR family oxidoreductase [Sphingosinicella sp.]